MHLSSAIRLLAPRPCVPPLWNELRSPFAAAPAVESGAQTGRGEPVVLVPGFLCSYGSLCDLRAFLRASGHRPQASGIACNVRCSEAAIGDLTERVSLLAERFGQRVALVGHSRGGLLARVLAHRRPDLVSGVVMLGSPWRDQLAVHPLIWAHAFALATVGTLGLRDVASYSCGAGRCCGRFRRDLAAPLAPSVGLLSIYSTRDGVVDWRACLDSDGRHVEVEASHTGMPTDPVTMRVIADALARLNPLNAALRDAA